VSVRASGRPAPSSAILTFLIADVRGYTAFTRAAGDEAAARLAAAFAEVVREGVEASGGDVVELRGDEALAVFGSARSAIRAAVELQQVFADESALEPAIPMRVGIGLDAGEAVPVEDGYRGAALNLAARLCAAAGPGEVLVSEGVVHLAGAMNDVPTRLRDGLSLKGVGEDVRAFEVTIPQVSASISGLRTEEVPVELDAVGPVVGRDRDVRWLRWAWRTSRRGPGLIRLVIGPQGGGRTRLAAEVAALTARDGCRVMYASGRDGPTVVGVAVDRAATATSPSLLVIDDLGEAAAEIGPILERLRGGSPGRLGLTVLIADEDPPPAIDRALGRLVDEAATLRLEPLDETGVAAIVELYARDVSGPPPIRAVLEASDGSPARVHALAAQWAQGEAARRLGGATTRAAEGRRDLRRLEAEVASNLIDLQFARERSQLLAADASSRSIDECPFRGLASFDVGDADLFFGRERLVAEMVGRLAGAPFLGVVGPSGSGKSSALRAGLVPALESGALPGSEGWVRILLRPGTEPLRELDRVAFAALDESQRQRLAHASDPLAEAAAVLPDDTKLLVVVDQFEEIFSAAVAPAERTDFVAALTDAAASGRAVVLVAVRADFYGRVAEFDALAGLLGTNHVLVGPMTPDEYRRVIEGPVRRSGLRIDTGLVDRLVADVVNQPGGLPLLSTALVELWQKRDGRSLTIAAYEASGGVSGAVARLAEAAYGKLDVEHQSTARSLFLRLASGAGDSVVRRRVPVSELDAATNETVRETLKVLTVARLLTVDEGTVEVAHEALLREWPRLAGWLEEDREGQRLRAHLAEAAREWEGAREDPGELYRGARLASTLDWTAEHNLELNELERRFVTESRTAAEHEAQRQVRANRRLRMLLAGALVALLVAVSAGGFAVIQRQAADQAATDAQSQRVKAEQAATEADAQRANAEQAATDADAQRLGAQALATKDLDLSLLLARQGLALDDLAPVRADLLAAISQAPAALRISRPLPGRPLSVQASADGATLLVSNNSNMVAIIDTASGQTRYVHQADGGEYPTIASDGTPFLVGGGGTRATITELARDSDHVTRTVTYPMADAWSIGWAPDLSTIDAVTPDGRELFVYDSTTLKVIRRIKAPPGMTIANVNGFAGGHLLLTETPGAVDPHGANLGRPGIEAWWGSSGNAPISTFRVPQAGASYSASPDGTTLALDNTPAVGHETLVDLRTGVEREVGGQHTDQINGSSFSPDAKEVLTGGDDLVARAWDVRTGALLQTFAGHNGRVFAPAVTSIGGKATVWTVSLDGSLIAWDLTGGRRFGNEFPAAHGVTAPSIALSPDGKLLAIGESTGAVVLDASSHAIVQELRTGSTDAPSSVAWSPDGTRLAVTGDVSSVVTLYDTATWSPVGGGPLAGPPPGRPSWPGEASQDPTVIVRLPDSAQSVAFSADSSRVVAGTTGGYLWTWNARTGSPVGAPVFLGGQILGVAVDPTNGWVAAGFDTFGPDGKATAGDAAAFAPGESTPRYIVDVDSGYGRADAVAFSPDGKTLATGGGTGDVRLWDATNGVPTGRHILAAAGWVLSIVWRADGQELVTGGTDGTVRLIDVGSATVAGSLPGVSHHNVAATFTTDGRNVLASYDDGTAFEWPDGVADWASTACSVAGRTLTQVEWDQYLPGRDYQPACAP
jgi:WD40 repeat protein/class 3 adenylate cyclase